MKMYHVIYDEYVFPSRSGEDEGDYWRTENVKSFETRWEAAQFMKKLIDNLDYRNILLTRTITEPKL